MFVRDSSAAAEPPPLSAANSYVYLSGLPPFDPESGEIKPQPFERQCELVLEQMKHCLEAAGSSLPQVIKCPM
jgi:2-iminobutanoate/2-iminopropanoate deaminase